MLTPRSDCMISTTVFLTPCVVISTNSRVRTDQYQAVCLDSIKLLVVSRCTVHNCWRWKGSLSINTRNHSDDFEKGDEKKGGW